MNNILIVLEPHSSTADSVADNMLGYLGPGAGLAISFSFLAILAVIGGVFLVLVLWPASTLLSLVRPKSRRSPRRFRRVVVLGLDGFDPKIIKRLMAQGKAPNFKALAEIGTFSPLRTTIPSLSPSVWSSFMTGNDASRHNIYDFINRDPGTYLPYLSSSEIVEGRRKLRLGRYAVPLSGSAVRTLRKGVPFWHALGRAGLETTVLRVPITFPPERFNGRLLAGMCVPDLLGTQGTYSYYGIVDRRENRRGGTFYPLHFEGGVAETHITGPKHPFLPHGESLTIPLSVRRTAGAERLTLSPGRHRFELTVGEYSEWIRLCFRAGPTKVYGLVQFCLIATEPQVQIYMTPVQIDPERPVMRISHPGLFSDYLAKRIGPFGTLGLMEDTSALNDGVLTERAFLDQVWRLYDERKAMFLSNLEQKHDDVTICVFDTPDRIQHMFWRYTEEDHPARRNRASEDNADVIDRMYMQTDELVGETMARLSRDTLLLVISDHGFTSFRRAVNLNAWLHQEGYLHLLPGAELEKDWLEGIDWSRTRAYAMGLTGIYINSKGRESKGIVEPGLEFDTLARELKSKLEAFEDCEHSDTSGAVSRPIRRVFITKNDFQGPFRQDGPDLLVGYEAGYRCSWECAHGQVTQRICYDNIRAWSGDHCVDPELVPGILFSNVPLAGDEPGIMDIAPTVLDTFGIAPETAMQGRSLLRAAELRVG